MLAARLPGILPPMDPREALDISMVHSVAGLLADGKLSRQRPFRDPHHSASLPAMVGGGTRAQPGEISLAHNGVLFLDELPEFAGIMQETHQAFRMCPSEGRVKHIPLARVRAEIAEWQMLIRENIGYGSGAKPSPVRGV